jgi:serine/threonine protein kinase
LLRFFVRCTSNNVADAPPPCKNFGRLKLDARALVGRTLNATYRWFRPIGSGCMGAILEAQNARLAHKRYAVKLLHPSLAMDPDTFHRFRREAEIASPLGHDHIVEVHDFNVTPEGEPYMVMEFLDGDDLAARIKARGPMSLAETSFILTQVASALEAAHAAGIVHRDLKPQNIFLCKRFGRDDFVKVLNFGLQDARFVERGDARPLAAGDAFYMSPEQADGRVAEIDRRTDVFALGAGDSHRAGNAAQGQGGDQARRQACQWPRVICSARHGRSDGRGRGSRLLPGNGEGRSPWEQAGPGDAPPEVNVERQLQPGVHEAALNPNRIATSCPINHQSTGVHSNDD